MIWPRDVYAGFRRLGFSRAFSTAITPIISGGLSFNTQTSKIPDPRESSGLGGWLVQSKRPQHSGDKPVLSQSAAQGWQNQCIAKPPATPCPLLQVSPSTSNASTWAFTPVTRDLTTPRVTLTPRDLM